MGYTTAIVLAGSLGFAAGYVVAKGPQDVWSRLLITLKQKQSDSTVAQHESEAQPVPLTHENLLSATAAATTGASPGACIAACRSGGLNAASGGQDTIEDGGDLSPTASLAGSIAGSIAASFASLPPTAAPSFNRTYSSGARSNSSSSRGSDKLRMVVVVRDDVLGRWGQGKMSVMIASCILSLYKRVYKNRDQRPTLMAWEAQKGAKVVLRCPDEASLTRLMDAARAAGVPAHCLLEMVPGTSPEEPPSRTRAIAALGPATHAALVAAGCQVLSAL